MPLAAGSFAFTQDYPGSISGQLRNDVTRVTTSVPAPTACQLTGGLAMSKTTLIASCANDWQRFALPNGPWIAFPEPATCQLLSSAPGPPVDCSLTAAGSQWLQATTSCYHCVTATYYESLSNYSERTAPDASTNSIDLDSKVLAHRLCPPVYTGGGTALVFGKYVLTNTMGTVKQWRCGMRHPRVLDRGVRGPVLPIAGGALWEVGPQLHGTWLASGDRFAMQLPKGIAGLGGLEVDTNAIYIQNPGTNGPAAWRGRLPQR